MAQRVERRVFKGVTYYRYPDSKRRTERQYFKRGPRYLHREIWADEHGPIPAGCHIHHRDEDTTNNALDNLELVTPRQHAGKHWSQASADRSRAHLDKVRPLAAEWHRSKAGREWHRQHGLKTIEKAERVQCVCEYCGKKYRTLKRRTNRFCSSKCRAYARRRCGIDDVTKFCAVCAVAFVANRYDRAKTCGRICGAALRKASE